MQTTKVVRHHLVDHSSIFEVCSTLIFELVYWKLSKAMEVDMVVEMTMENTEKDEKVDTVFIFYGKIYLE